MEACVCTPRRASMRLTGGYRKAEKIAKTQVEKPL